jgi:hypothetical protein
MLLRVSIGAQRHERIDSHCSTGTGFRIYVVGSREGGRRSALHPRVIEEFL